MLRFSCMLSGAQHDTLLYEKLSEEDTRLYRCLISERDEASTFVVQVASVLNIEVAGFSETSVYIYQTKRI